MISGGRAPTVPIKKPRNRSRVVRFVEGQFSLSHLPLAYAPVTKDPLDVRLLSRNNRRDRLLVKFADGGMHRVAFDPANWTYAAGNGEASFRIR